MFLYFILGILFIEVVIPVVEALVTLILTWIEVAKGKSSLKITQLSADIQKLSEPEEPPPQAIGFVVPTEEYEEEEDDE